MKLVPKLQGYGLFGQREMLSKKQNQSHSGTLKNCSLAVMVRGGSFNVKLELKI